MRFSTRNVYYLRISASVVLPLNIYLDEQHVGWMSERVLQHVLSDLRPLIPNKLMTEADAHLGPGGPANAKKGTLDVHRGDTYQFGYFLRSTDPHVLVVKTRRFTAVPKGPKPAITTLPTKEEDDATADASSGRKRKRSTRATKKALPQSGRKRSGKGKGKQKAVDPDSSEGEAIDTDDADAVVDSYRTTLTSRRSTRKRAVISGAYRETEESDDEGPWDEPTIALDDSPKSDHVPDNTRTPPAEADVDDVLLAELNDTGLVTMDHEESESPLAVKAEPIEPVLQAEPSFADDPMDVEEVIEAPPASLPVHDVLDEEDEEEKPKPIMSLRYKGFSIHGRCLCVIVEPWPPVRQQREMSLQPMGLAGPRAPSIAPPDFVPSTAARRERTPLFLPEPDERDRSVTPAPTPHRVLPPVPLWNDNPNDEEETDGGMLAFSQVLHSIGGYSTGAIEDEDEIDGAVFLGDADEARGYE